MHDQVFILIMITPAAFQLNYPFVSCIKSNETEYVGIIINLDNFIASIYDISSIRSEDEKKLFLESKKTVEGIKT